MSDQFGKCYRLSCHHQEELDALRARSRLLDEAVEALRELIAIEVERKKTWPRIRHDRLSLRRWSDKFDAVLKRGDAALSKLQEAEKASG